MSPNDIIYESPDSGETIYARESGSLDRQKIHESDYAKTRGRWLRWIKILNAAQNNSALNDIIQQAEMLYELVKDDKET